MTTNGVLPPRFAAGLKRSGLTGINIGIDSPDPDRYAAITRGGSLGDAGFERVN